MLVVMWNLHLTVQEIMEEVDMSTFWHISFWPKIWPWREWRQNSCQSCWLYSDLFGDKADSWLLILLIWLHTTSSCSPNSRGHWKESDFRQERTWLQRQPSQTPFRKRLSWNVSNDSSTARRSMWRPNETTLRVIRLPHLPYLLPSSFHLYPKLNIFLVGQRFSSNVMNVNTGSKTRVRGMKCCHACLIHLHQPSIILS
jgi:hypothetical protein